VRLEHSPGGIVSYADRDPFHYSLAQLAALAPAESWRHRYVGDWGHPRAQRMLCLERR
jgi:hypothetical protein